MTSSVVLFDRLSSKKSTRVHVEGVDFTSNVSDFRKNCAKTIDVPVNSIELLYCGRRLKDDRSLASYGVKKGCTVHALKKAVEQPPAQMPEPMDSTAIQQVVTALQAALLNPAHRNTVEEMLSKPDTLENLVAATPGLDRDPVAMAMLQDSEMMAILADPSHIHQVIEAHPCLGHAAVLVAAAVNEEAAKEGAAAAAGAASGSGAPSRGATYSLDQMSDDEDMPQVPPGGLRGQNQPITASQLTAALEAASGRGQPSPGTSSSRARGPAPPAAQDITTDFFQQALAQASGAPPVVTDAQIQQMRDMGITDEARARQALEAAGGNIQAALGLLFEDGDM